MGNFKINPKLIRSQYLADVAEKIMEEKHLNDSLLAEKIGASRSTLTNMLNGRTRGTDEMFRRIFYDGFGFTKDKVEQIFKEADIEEFIYKYGNELPNNHKMSIKEALDFIKSNANLSLAEKAVLEVIEERESKLS